MDRSVFEAKRVLVVVPGFRRGMFRILLLLLASSCCGSVKVIPSVGVSFSLGFVHPWIRSWWGHRCLRGPWVVRRKGTRIVGGVPGRSVGMGTRIVGRGPGGHGGALALLGWSTTSRAKLRST